MALGFSARVMDPVLALHSVSPHRFELSGLRTGSVRDQMLRAHLVVEQLIKNQCVDSASPLFIAGGGVAGIVAALTASRRRIPVMMVEQHDGPLRTQMAARGRRLDPAEYDWPQPHWDKACTLWKKGDLPLHYPCGDADTLAQRWEEAFFAWLDLQANGATNYGVIDYYFGVDARKFRFAELADKDREGVMVSHPVAPNASHYCGAALSCIGFSGERVSAPSIGRTRYKGNEFWGVDALDSDHLHLDPVRHKQIRVCVSGGGDGAQQDIQRALTGRFGRALMDELADSMPALDLIGSVLAEDSARRAFVWRNNSQILKQTLIDWHEQYERLVARIWSTWTTEQRHAIASRLLRPNINLTWILGGDVPDFCFGLNRLLTMLVLNLHAEQSSRDLQTAQARDHDYAEPADEVIVRGHWLQMVTPTEEGSHICGEPKGCLGKPHTVHVASDLVPAPSSRWKQLAPFHLVVVRHGVDQAPLFGRQPIKEQIVPFGIPR